MTQEALADAATSISVHYLRQLEQGRRRWNVDQLVAIADALEVDARDLMPEGEIRENPAPALPPAKQALLDAVDDAGPEALAAAARVLARALEAARG